MDSKIEYALTVASPLLNPELVKPLQEHESKSTEITRQVNYEDLDYSSAYEIMLEEHNKLYGQIMNIISETSGVKN